jgi:hypothetical protein
MGTGIANLACIGDALKLVKSNLSYGRKASMVIRMIIGTG